MYVVRTMANTLKTSDVVMHQYFSVHFYVSLFMERKMVFSVTLDFVAENRSLVISLGKLAYETWKRQKMSISIQRTISVLKTYS